MDPNDPYGGANMGDIGGGGGAFIGQNSPQLGGATYMPSSGNAIIGQNGYIPQSNPVNSYMPSNSNSNTYIDPNTGVIYKKPGIVSRTGNAVWNGASNVLDTGRRAVGTVGESAFRGAVHVGGMLERGVGNVGGGVGVLGVGAVNAGAGVVSGLFQGVKALG